jgi:hypothetical protein
MNPRPGVRVAARQWRRGFSPAYLAVGVFLAAILVPVGLMIYSAVRGGEPLVLVRTAADALTAAATTGRAAPARLTLKDLDELAPGYHPLDATAPPTVYESFDAITSLQWATTIAQAWATDSRLDRIDVVRVHADGLIDVAGDPDAEVIYRFVSPDRLKDLRRRADLSANANVQTELWVRVKSGEASVVAPATPAALLAFRDQEGLAPEPPRALPLADTFVKLAGHPPFMAELYKGYLLYSEPDGWMWYLSTLAGEPLPRIRSTDGKTFPYR